MATQHENGSEIDPNSTSVETEAEKLGTSGSAIPIEEGVEKITLAGGSTRMATQHENGSEIDLNPITVETEAEKLGTSGSAIPIEEGVEKITLAGGSARMATQHVNGSDIDPNHISVETEAEMLGTSGSAILIEEGVEKITLAGGSLSTDENSSVGKSESKSERENESENSESESSSSSSESSSSSSGGGGSDSDNDEEDAQDDLEEGEISDTDADRMLSWSDVDGDDNEDIAEPIKSKNELQNLPPVPPVNVTLEPHHQMLPVGVVLSILGAHVIVEGVEKHDPLNEGSILWLTESRKPLGLVDEIFGPVKSPYYVVRYNSKDEVPEGIQGGTLISFVPEFADRVLNSKDLYKKGYDASGVNDEELSDEVEFSDDEKEAEYRRRQKMTKRGMNDQNPSKSKSNRKKVSQKEHAVPTIRNAPVAPMVDHGNCSSDIGQAVFRGTSSVPPFPPLNAAPNFAQNLVWANNATLPQQPPPTHFPDGFSPNAIPYYPQNAQMSYQLPLPGIPFQQQLHPNQGYLPTTILPGVQPYLFEQPMYEQGFVGQNPMTFGLNSPFPQIQPPICPAQQGFPSAENVNLHSNPCPGACPPFCPGSSADGRGGRGGRGRRAFHGAGRRGWQPAE